MKQKVITTSVQRLWNHKIVRFGLVGGTAFVIDTLCFALLYSVLGLSAAFARAIAMVVAATSTWLGNRTFTFKDSTQPKGLQWAKSLVASGFSALPNMGTFLLVNHWLEGYPWGPYASLILGVAVGTVCNFLLASRWVFRGGRSTS